MKPAIAASYSDTVQTFCQSPPPPARAGELKTLYAQTLNRFKLYTLGFMSGPDVNTHIRPGLAETAKQPKDVADKSAFDSIKEKLRTFHFDQPFSFNHPEPVTDIANKTAVVRDDQA